MKTLVLFITHFIAYTNGFDGGKYTHVGLQDYTIIKRILYVPLHKENENIMPYYISPFAPNACIIKDNPDFFKIDEHTIII